jgi:hypothetical protein
MAATTAASNVQIVPLTLQTAEVRVRIGGATVTIGRVTLAGDRWYWQHRDGERSSPIAVARSEAAAALAEYHRTFKSQPAVEPVRRLLFG